jgi:hypothetical protein
MKKLFLGIALCSLLFGAASCAKETVEQSTKKGAMSFKAALGKQTRAEETTFSSLIEDGAQLNVYAYRVNETEEFNKFELTYDDDTEEWTYSPVKYQPGFLLRYYSVYPAFDSDPVAATEANPEAGTDATSGVSNDDLTFDYTVAATPDTQKDLIAATVAPTMVEVIHLQYAHLLSQVNFAVQAIEDVKIEIGDITVDAVKDKNTYSFKNNSWGSTPSQSENFAAYKYVPDETSLATLAAGSSAGIVYLGNGKDAASGYTYDNALMLMPQTFVAGGDGTFSFEFSLTVDIDNDGDFTDTGDGGAAVKATDEPVTVNFGDFDKLTWESGKRYIYVIDFTSYIAGGPITFTVDVTEWKDADETTDTAQTVQVAQMTAADINEAIALQAAANEDTSSLKVFPINVTGSDNVTISHIYDFDAEDKIVLEFEDATAAGKFVLATSYLRGWSRDDDGKVVTLTCTKPTIYGGSAVANTSAAENDAAIREAIYTATSALNASGDASAYKEYTVKVGKVYGANATLPAPDGLYNTGDRVYLVFRSAMELTITEPDGWTLDVLDNVNYILTKSAPVE